MAENPSPRVRSLFMLANPVDLPRFDADFLWEQIEEAVEPFRAGGALLCERVRPPISSVLRNKLAAAPWNVLHVVAHPEEMAAAHYGILVLERSDGAAGRVTAQAFAATLATCPSLAVVVLQSTDDGPPPFDIAAAELIAHGIACVVTTPRLREPSQKMFLARLYSGLLQGLSGGELAVEIASAGGSGERPSLSILSILSRDPGLNQIRVISRDPERPLIPLPDESAAPGRVRLKEPAVAAAAGPPAWHEILRRKREANAYDVFLCHNSADKPAVRRIAQQLKEAGILPWLDVEELPPGQPWQPLLEQQIKNIRSAAVCFGSAGIGPWQELEMRGFLNAFVKRGVPVIPLLLPDAPFAPDLPIFLAEMTWVDFRATGSGSLAQLIWGITGKRPDF